MSKTFKPDIDVIFIYLLLFTVYFNAMFKGGFVFYSENQQKLEKFSGGEKHGGITMAGWFSNPQLPLTQTDKWYNCQHILLRFDGNITAM